MVFRVASASMKVLNIHQRELPVAAKRVGSLINSLASPDDALWPRQWWPRIAFDRPLSVGASGGHGPIGYCIEEYRPGESIRFRFLAPRGFDGFHRLDLVREREGAVILRHTLQMTARGLSTLWWSLAIRHVHDALIEDAFATAERSLGLRPQLRSWSAWVKLLRWLMSGGRAGPQAFANA
jgi:hypothetical protein